MHLNLAYRCLCRLGLEDEVPNLSTYSKGRHGLFRGSDLFRWLFNEVLHGGRLGQSDWRLVLE